jgi:hypothetical protein
MQDRQTDVIDRQPQSGKRTGRRMTGHCRADRWAGVFNTKGVTSAARPEHLAEQGCNVQFCMPNRTDCILLIAAHPEHLAAGVPLLPVQRSAAAQRLRDAPRLAEVPARTGNPCMAAKQGPNVLICMPNRDQMSCCRNPCAAKAPFTEMMILLWLPNRVQISYSLCQIEPGISQSLQQGTAKRAARLDAMKSQRSAMQHRAERITGGESHGGPASLCKSAHSTV